MKPAREIIEDLVSLAECAMQEANRDGAEYDIEGELQDAKDWGMKHRTQEAAEQAVRDVLSEWGAALVLRVVTERTRVTTEKFEQARVTVYQADRQITVHELMEMLKRCKPESFVTVEGCDCTGECEGLTDYGEGVMIARRSGS